MASDRTSPLGLQALSLYVRAHYIHSESYFGAKLTSEYVVKINKRSQNIIGAEAYQNKED